MKLLIIENVAGAFIHGVIVTQSDTEFKMNNISL